MITYSMDKVFRVVFNKLLFTTFGVMTSSIPVLIFLIVQLTPFRIDTLVPCTLVLLFCGVTTKSRLMQ